MLKPSRSRTERTSKLFQDLGPLFASMYSEYRKMMVAGIQKSTATMTVMRIQRVRSRRRTVIKVSDDGAQNHFPATL
jgi:hypothetical protein